MLISRGIEISIARGGGEMVRAYLLVAFFFFLSFFFSFFFFCNHAFIVLSTKSLMQCEL